MLDVARPRDVLKHTCVVLPLPVSPLTTATSDCSSAASSGPRIWATGSASRLRAHSRPPGDALKAANSLCSCRPGSASRSPPRLLLRPWSIAREPISGLQ